MNTKLYNEERNGETATGRVKTILLGQDVHAGTVVVEVQYDGSMPQPAQRIATDEYVAWVKRLTQRHPQAKVYAVYEAGPCGYWLHRELEALGVSSRVAAPVAMNGRRKCDQRDASSLRQKLREYVEGNKRAFSVVWVPTPQQEQERALLRHRSQLVRALRRAEQQGRSKMLLHGIRVRGAWWSPRRWSELQLQLPAWIRELLADFQAQAQLVHEQIRAAEVKIQQLAQAKEVHAPRGIGVMTWLTLLLELGNWERFTNRRQVGSSTGLCGSESSSGEHRREGPIDRRGNPRVRHALIEAVWRLLRWQPGYPPLQRIVAAKSGRARRRAAVAVARRLAIDLWRLATGQTTAAAIHLDATV